MTLSIEDFMTHADEAIIDAAYSKHLSDASILLIASRAVRCAADDLGCEVLPALLDGAVAGLIRRCWEARERRQQMDIFEELEAAGPVFDRAQYLGDRL
jgi:hypothetical protein